MNRSRRLWRSLLFLFLITALCGNFALPVVNVRAIQSQQAVSCSSGTVFTKWTFDLFPDVNPSIGSGTFLSGSDLSGPSTLPGPAGATDLAINFGNWPTTNTISEGQSIEFDVDTTTKSSLVLSFDYRASAKGPKTLELHYSTDGTSFVLFDQAITLQNDASWHTLTFDLSSVAALNNNANSKFKIYAYGSTIDTGTLGFNNVVFCTLPSVVIDSINPNPTNDGTTVTWHAASDGTYEVRLGGTSCSTGKVVATGSYTANAPLPVDIKGGDLIEGSTIVRVCFTDASALTQFAVSSVTKDVTEPTVTVNRAANQAASTSFLPINFLIAFSEPIDTSTLKVSDITQGGTATGVTWKITDSGDHKNFTLQVTAAKGFGTLIPSIDAGKVNDLAGNGNLASTGNNQVNYGSSVPQLPIVIINEVAWSGTAANAADEWIELHNTTSDPIDITGWTLYGDDNVFNKKTGSPQISLKGTIPAEGYFLLEANESATDVPAKQVYSANVETLLNSGERLYLVNGNNTIVDSANPDGGSWPAGTAVTTSTSLPSYASMERLETVGNQWVTYNGTVPIAHDRSGNGIKGTPGRGNWISTTSVTTITYDYPDPSLVNQNVTVYVTVMGGSSTPTGTVSITGASTNCTLALVNGTGSCLIRFTVSGSKTITATYSGDGSHPVSSDTETHTVTTSFTFRTPTPIPAPPPQLVVINEFVPRPGHDWNHDGVVNVGDEYIELLNHGNVDVNLSGWRLDDEVNIGSNPYSLPAKVLKPGERVVFYGSETSLLLSDGGDAVRLLKPNGQLIDAYNYTVAGYPDQSFCRLPDNGGADDWNKNCYPTPGFQNSISGSGVTGSKGMGQESLCPIADTLPYDFVWAECDPFGNNIFRPSFWDKTGWYDDKSLPIDGKWNIFAD